MTTDQAANNPFVTIGKSDTKSREKASNANRRANALASQETTWPVNENGQPLAKLTMSAAELCPTGQYANVSIGPAQITIFVDPTKKDQWENDELENVAKALNELAAVIEQDVVAVQRALVMQNLQRHA